VKLDDFVTFLAVEDIDAAHEDVIREFGGDPGTRDAGLVESAVIAPRNGHYASMAELAGVYVYGLTKNHGYIDGNKRVAAIALRMFLRANHLPAQVGVIWAGIIHCVAADYLTRENLTELITTELMDGHSLTFSD
jgi:death-on-curing protein